MSMNMVSGDADRKIFDGMRDDLCDLGMHKHWP